jgi:hypothetical protein
MLAASIIRAIMMAVASTSETSVNFYQTSRRNIPEDSHLHTRCRENLKSHDGGGVRITISSALLQTVSKKVGPTKFEWLPMT